MTSWVVTDMGGETPRLDPRLLPQSGAEEAWNVDLNSGPLDGLPLPQFLVDLTPPAIPVAGAPPTFPVARAYRFPGPDPATDLDVWLPLPSVFSSVVTSPLANDTLHRIYWTNPPTPASLDPASGVLTPAIVGGAYWTTYQRLKNNWFPYDLGFTAPNPATVLTVATADGSLPGFVAVNPVIVGPGTGYAVNDLIYIPGTVIPGRIVNEFSVLKVDAAGGLLMVRQQDYDLKGYLAAPGNPSGTLNVVGPGPDMRGVGVLGVLSVEYLPIGVPKEERVYLYTFVDEYGLESSPSAPSAVTAGATDGKWTLTGYPTAVPAMPAGKVYPAVVAVRIYRTVVGTTSGATFYRIYEYLLPVPNTDPGHFDDVWPDVTVAQNVTLQSTAWLPPPAGLDGLTAMPGGMLVGFTGNTLHFCEPNRPHAWPAGYDISVRYPIVGLALWQSTLMVLTSGYPSSGSGNMPSNFTLSQVQVAEPCIARGSIVTDLLGVYYASQNGLVMLSYYGMQNQTLSTFSKNIWLRDFNARSIVACRHRAQYLALTRPGDTSGRPGGAGPPLGFLIDYTEARMGVVRLSNLATATSVWNDVTTGDAYLCANQKVYRWDSPAMPSMVWRWRSKKFAQIAPTNIGACQVTLSEDAVVQTPTPYPFGDTDPALLLPDGVMAIFRLFIDDGVKVFERALFRPREIFRMPSGFKTFDFQFEIVGRTPVFKVELASTMKELRNV